MLYKFNILFLLSYLNYKITSISSLSSSSTLQYTINNSSTYLYEHSEFILLHLQLYSIHVDKTITTDSPKSFYINFVSCSGNCCLYNAGILCSMLLLSYYTQNMLAWWAQPINRTIIIMIHVDWSDGVAPYQCTVIMQWVQLSCH